MDTFDILNKLFDVVDFIIIMCMISIGIGLTLNVINPNWTLYADTQTGQFAMAIIGSIVGLALVKFKTGKQ